MAEGTLLAVLLALGNQLGSPNGASDNLEVVGLGRSSDNRLPQMRFSNLVLMLLGVIMTTLLQACRPRLNCRTRSELGFTLVELLVVIAIIGVLVALLLPAVQSAREAARRTTCTNKLKQLGLACQNYYSAFGKLPPGGSDYSTPFGNGYKSPGGPSWIAYLMPYAEDQNLWDAMDFDRRPYGPMLDVLANTPVPSIRCPSSPLPQFSLNRGTLAAVSDYVGISGHVGGFGGLEGPVRSDNPFGPTFGVLARNGVFYDNSKTSFKDITDGTSKTMIASEVSDFIFVSTGQARDYRPGGRGETETENGPGFHAGWQRNTTPDVLYNCTTLSYIINPGEQLLFSTDSTDGVHFRGYNTPLRSAHPGGILVALADGSVRFLVEDVSTITLARLSDRSDGFPIEEF